MFDSLWQIDENQSVGTSVATVTGADSDTGDEGQLTYSITGKTSMSSVLGEINLTGYRRP